MARIWPILLLLCGFSVGAPPSASAWVHYRTGDTAGCGLRWYAADGKPLTPVVIPISTDSVGVEGVSQAAFVDAVKAALAAWPATTCPADAPATASQPLGASFVHAGSAVPTAVGAACLDNNAICQVKVSNGNFFHVVRDAKDWPYGQSIFALTVLTYDKCTGEIVDGDVLLDDNRHDFCLNDCKLGQQSLCNTLSHETGHLLGLDHSSFADATMDASGPSGETKKCTLHGDDRQGICAAYAGGCGKAHRCVPVTPGEKPPTTGCVSAPISAAGWGGAAACGIFTCTLIGLRWRRRVVCNVVVPSPQSAP